MKLTRRGLFGAFAAAVAAPVVARLATAAKAAPTSVTFKGITLRHVDRLGLTPEQLEFARVLADEMERSLWSHKVPSGDPIGVAYWLEK